MIEANFETQSQLLELTHRLENEMKSHVLMANNKCQGVLNNSLLYFSLNSVHV